jgi:hypothetical protein
MAGHDADQVGRQCPEPTLLLLAQAKAAAAGP